MSSICSIHSRMPLPQKCITFHGFLVHARLKWLPSESPTQEQLKDTVMRMREKGLKETGCNAAIRAINAYLHWNSGSERKCGAGCTHLFVQQLKEPQNILPTLTADQVTRLVNWKPQAKTFLPTAAASAHAVAARYRLPHYGGLYLARPVTWTWTTCSLRWTARGENREEAIPVVLRGVQLTGCALNFAGKRPAAPDGLTKIPQALPWVQASWVVSSSC
jgi:hypothetical protein